MNAMATNFLYMFEFCVDDLLITKPNCCAPEEYPTCVELSFRSSVFICICDREYNKCVDICAPKCCKCCLFSLESEITDMDRLKVHVYKKKDEKCKFLEGAADLPIKTLFEKVTYSFDETNPNWLENSEKTMERLPDTKHPNKIQCTDCFTCDDCALAARPEQFCPTNATVKRLLPLYDMHGVQTGNLSLLVRLVCNGPAIVSSYQFSKICNAACDHIKNLVDTDCVPKITNCDTCEALELRGVGGGNHHSGQKGACVQPDPCIRCVPKKPPCKRYFACNLDKDCPCSDCEDYCDRECPTGCSGQKAKLRSKCPHSASPCGLKRQAAAHSTTCQEPCFTGYHNRQANKPPQPSKCELCSFIKGGNDCCCEDCQKHIETANEDEDDQSIKPCLIEPSRPNPGPEAYEEFETAFNDCGLVIRLLKHTHKVECIHDGQDSVDMEPDCEIPKEPEGACQSLTDLFKKSLFVRRRIETQTRGNIINHPILPKIRANVKYSGQDTCCPESYHLNFSNLRDTCQENQHKLDYYRRSKGGMDCELNHPLGADMSRACCVQVDPKILAETSQGKYVDNRKKGIEVCYKTCDDLDSDVFLMTLGKKESCKAKRNAIEIELKTPKGPTLLQKQKVTTETQINEAELDAALSQCKKKKKKKKGKKGKGKRKAKGKKQ